jgi:hypothetical protein
MLAEGLAQAVVHHDWWYTEYLQAAEAQAAKWEESALPMSACIDLAQANVKLCNCSSLDYHVQSRPVSGEFAMDAEPARDGVLANAKEEILRIAARYRVNPNDLDRATAELQNAAGTSLTPHSPKSLSKPIHSHILVYLTAGAQLPPYICVFDFGLLHTVTSSVGLSVFLSEPSLSPAQKARILEYTGRIYLMTYVANGAPEIRLDWLSSHPSKLQNQTWDTVFDRATYHEDDGHMSKLIRGIAHAEKTSKPYDHLPEFKIKQPLFLTAGVAAMDSGSSKPMEHVKHFDFVRGAGFKEAWKRYPYREGPWNELREGVRAQL